MILKMPEHFDQDEWFIITVIFLGIIMYNILPKRFPTVITAVIILYSIAIPRILDYTIAIDHFHLYYLTDSNKLDLFDVIMDGIYPPFGYLYIYIYDYFKFKNVLLVLYVAAWSLIAIGTEFIASQFHVYHYFGWKLSYSLPIYTLVLTLNILIFNCCMNNLKNNVQIPIIKK
ncbi:hypothetical protein [Heyndrickxia ginsengihumi]|uniref:Uncharacterized protein n=1 Tax=Heyndrickxia ginsengihumi TaxID=363870 RepID=A0A0A6VB44_9BACI|nr:hypothetical protein [Heyndrickxia ginsengihumi]KHD84733.1 hypothetical protein NG54_13550 [Heyndrickxia ginsengihumi]MBE6185394.1 hypothetical protein [Bacillus sp. (in: firmicutes)]MCM3023532.1 hypothetical protein [Heyndrickxia ginsengihumi]NEY20314.1 hypothetical protein [Heyndrickxia ginsengihumi]